MSPVLGLLAKDVGLAFGVGLAYEAVNNYIRKPTTAGAAPTIPTSKKATKVSPKTAQKNSLGDYALGVAGIMATSATAVSNALTTGKTSAESFSTSQNAKTSELLTTSSASPLLTNQVFMKDSLDKLIDAINSNTLVTASVFGTLDANLSAIGSSLTSISATLIEVSGNYQDEINNTGEIPYIDGQNYYDMLSDTNMNIAEISNFKQGEDMIVSSMMSNGSSYSDIKTAVQDYRNTTVPIQYQQQVESSLAGITKSSPVTSNGSFSSGSVTIPDNLNVTIKRTDNEIALTDKKLAHITYETTPIQLDNILEIPKATPQEMRAIKDAVVAKKNSDENTFDLDDTDFDDLFNMPDISSIFNFEKKSTRIANYNIP